MLSAPHLILVFLVALLVFGPEKLPELARNMSKWMGDFRRYSGDFQETFQREMRQLERDATEHSRSKAPPPLAPASSSGPSEAVTQHEDENPSGAASDGTSPEGTSLTQEDGTAYMTEANQADSADGPDGEFTGYGYRYGDPYPGEETVEGHDAEWQAESAETGPAGSSEHATATEEPPMDSPDPVKSSTEENAPASAGSEHPFNDHPSAA